MLSFTWDNWEITDRKKDPYVSSFNSEVVNLEFPLNRQTHEHTHYKICYETDAIVVLVAREHSSHGNQVDNSVGLQITQ